MGNKRDEELKNIMNVEMSKAVQLDEVIHMLVFDNIKISEGIIKELDNGKSGYQLLVDYW